MDDVIGSAGAWTLDTAARHAMLLDVARTALTSGDPSEAVVLAEELLDEVPDDIEALLIVADAAPRYGHGEVGALAAAQARQRGANIGALEAAALLAACQVGRALDAADAALLLAPEDARAYAIRGQALELLGRLDEGEAALRRAAELDAARFPPSLVVPEDEWESLLFAASARLEPSLRDALRGLLAEWRELPDVEHLLALQPPPSPLVNALLQDPDAREPRLELYRRNLVRGVADLEQLEDRLVGALTDELELLLEDDRG